MGRKEGRRPFPSSPFPSGAPAKKGKKEEMAAAAEVSPFIYYLLPSPFAGLQVPPSPPPPQALFTHSARGRERGERRRHKKPYLTHFCCVDRGDEGNVRVRKNGGVGDGGGDPSPLSQTGQTSRGRRDGGGGRMKGDISRGGGLHSSFHARPELEEERHFEKKKMFDLCVWHWQKLIRERTKVFLGCSPISRCPLLVDRDASIRGRGRVYD